MKALLTWMQQPTSVAGISAAFGTVSALLLHQVSWAHALPLLAGSLVSIILPDNTGVKTDAEDLTEAVLTKLHVG